MAAGTSIRLSNGEVLRSDPTMIYNVSGYGKCPAEEILVGDFIKFGRGNVQVVSSFTWRVQGRRQAC